ncbi:MAG: LON peptidase substrate-binding domain-containing protein, partial [Vicinamibacteraceae bacterium]|nr:LON peptidase substrate-binding domain-containing protein [Vicinamibacteraceae bacterium]
MLPPVIPIFPLPGAVLFPNVFLPLHIFEPRYRAMVRDALDGDRLIGMTLLKPGWRDDYEGRPPVYSIGCAGLISHAERLPDGRFNIVLRGLEKFRIHDEDHSRPYRLATIEGLPEAVTEADRTQLRHERRRLEALALSVGEGTEPPVAPDMPDEDLVNALAQYLTLDPIERQALLEQPGLLTRCRALADLLEMKVMTSTSWPPPMA